MRCARVALAICLVTAACTESSSVPEITGSIPAEEEPQEFTEFTTSIACDSAAEDANLQVVEAFFNAYNDRDSCRLNELAPSDKVPIAYMSGIPHLGMDEWTGVEGWAERGWSVGDRFELSRLVTPTATHSAMIGANKTL